jgi:transposase
MGLLQTGMSERQVARTLNVSHSVVQRMWNRFQIEGNVAHLHGGGRSRFTTHAQYQYIVFQARRIRFQNATSLRHSLQNTTNKRVYTQTIWNRLHDAGMNA